MLNEYSNGIVDKFKRLFFIIIFHADIYEVDILFINLYFPNDSNSNMFCVWVNTCINMETLQLPKSHHQLFEIDYSCYVQDIFWGGG